MRQSPKCQNFICNCGAKLISALEIHCFQRYAVLTVSNCVCHVGTSCCGEMCWGGILMWNVYMLYLNTMLSTLGQCQGCPFWCCNAQKEATWRGSHAKQKRNLAFSCWWNAENFMGQSQPPGPSFPHEFISRVSRCHARALKNPVSGLRGCYVPWSTKKRATGEHFDI